MSNVLDAKKKEYPLTSEQKKRGKELGIEIRPFPDGWKGDPILNKLKADLLKKKGLL